eukprot:2785004-Amphidinium_carterae.2
MSIQLLRRMACTRQMKFEGRLNAKPTSGESSSRLASSRKHASWIAKVLQEHNLSEGSLGIGSILEGVKALLQCHHFTGLLVDSLRMVSFSKNSIYHVVFRCNRYKLFSDVGFHTDLP